MTANGKKREDYSTVFVDLHRLSMVLVTRIFLHFFRFLFINPKEDNVNSLYMGLEVADPESLPSGWRRYVKLRLSVANLYFGEVALLNGDSYCSNSLNINI